MSATSNNRASDVEANDTHRSATSARPAPSLDRPPIVLRQRGGTGSVAATDHRSLADHPGSLRPTFRTVEKALDPGSFAEYLRTEIRARNLTVRSLARRTGVNHSTISRLLQGERTPTLTTAQRLHAALGGPDAARFFGASPRPGPDPVRRIEEALRADPLLPKAAARELMNRYLRLRDPSRPRSPDARPTMTSIRNADTAAAAGQPTSASTARPKRT